jgi:hypothetical protein
VWVEAETVWNRAVHLRTARFIYQCTTTEAKLGVQIMSSPVASCNGVVFNELEMGICGGSQPTLSAAVAARRMIRPSLNRLTFRIGPPVLGPILNGFGAAGQWGYGTDCLREYFCVACRLASPSYEIVAAFSLHHPRPGPAQSGPFVRGVTAFARPPADLAVQPSERENSTQPGRRRPARRPSRRTILDLRRSIPPTGWPSRATEAATAQRP